jgi:hypothetical protein
MRKPRAGMPLHGMYKKRPRAAKGVGRGYTHGDLLPAGDSSMVPRQPPGAATQGQTA